MRKFTKPVEVDTAAMTLNGFPFRDGRTGAPILTQAVAFVECEVRNAGRLRQPHLLHRRGRRRRLPAGRGDPGPAHGGHPHELRRVMEAFSGAVLTGGRAAAWAPTRRSSTSTAAHGGAGGGALRAAGAATSTPSAATSTRCRPRPRRPGRPPPGRGAAGGLLTAFDLAGHDLVVVLATDLAWIDAATVAALVAAAPAAGSVAVAARRPARAALRGVAGQPLPAGLEAAFDAGERAVHRALAGLDRVEVAVAPRAVANANTPADLHR